MEQRETEGIRYIRKMNDETEQDFIVTPCHHQMHLQTLHLFPRLLQRARQALRQCAIDYTIKFSAALAVAVHRA
jgi:hypothetical protein